jgi:uncharacterized protein (DUF433 family)
MSVMIITSELCREEVSMAFDRISVDPDICQGQPTIRGTRITVVSSCG